MRRFIRSLLGCSLREARADEVARRQTETHAIAMQVMDLRVEAAQAAAEESERAAQAMLRHLKEDMPHGMD